MKDFTLVTYGKGRAKHVRGQWPPVYLVSLYVCDLDPGAQTMSEHQDQDHPKSTI